MQHVARTSILRHIGPLAVIWTITQDCTFHLDGSGDRSSNSVHIVGAVTSRSGTVVGAQVAVGSTSTITDSAGRFDLVVGDSPDRVSVRVSAASYAPNVAVVFRRAGVYHYHRDVFLFNPQVLSVNAAAGGSMAIDSPLGSGARLVVPPGAMGSAGDVRVRVAAFDARRGPGALDTPDPAGENRLLSVGMFYVDAVDAAGNALGMTGVRIDLSPFTPAMIPDAQPVRVYRMGEDGAWIEPQDTPQPTAGTVISIPEPGFWNADARFRTACVRGRVRSSTSQCGGQIVQASGPDGISTFDSTGADGSFCVEGAQTWTSTLTIGSTTMPARLGGTPK